MSCILCHIIEFFKAYRDAEVTRYWNISNHLILKISGINLIFFWLLKSSGLNVNKLLMLVVCI